MFAQLTDRLAIGDQTAPEQLAVLTDQGYTMVIDLCTAQEGVQISEADVRAAGLQLRRMPVSVEALGLAVVARFREAVADARGPVYARCSSSRRAALLSFLAIATEERWTEDMFFARIDAAGFDCASAPALATFAHDYMRALDAGADMSHM